MKPQTAAILDKEIEEPPGKRVHPTLPPRQETEKGLLPFYPNYFEQIRPVRLQKYYSRNGHLKLVKTLTIEVIDDIDRCQELWMEFSPNKTVFDTWEFRLAFWKGYHHTPYFLLLKREDEHMALLPLWWEADKKQYFWFGSWWQEESTFFVKDPLLVPLLLSVCPEPVLLNAINLETVQWAKEFVDFTADDPKYILNLDSIHSVDDFLAIFNKKRRYNLKRDRRHIEEQKPTLIFDHFSDFDQLVNLSKERFYQKGEDTDWDDPSRIETFRHVIALGKKELSYKVRMLTVKIGGKIAGVDLITLFKGCYAPVKCGYNVHDFPGIGNYMNLIEIEDALSLGMKKIDFLEISYGWKDRWFEEIPLFKYDKGDIGPITS